MSRIKGISVIALVKVLRADRATARTLLPQGLHRYLDERILANAWYPDEEHRILLLAAGEMLRPHVPGDVFEFMGEQGANAEFTSVYASVVRKDDPWGTLKHSGVIWSMYRDTGRLEVHLLDPRNARLSLVDYPLAAREICSTLTGYYRALLGLSGAKNVRVTLEVLRTGGQGPTEWSAHFE